MDNNLLSSVIPANTQAGFEDLDALLAESILEKQQGAEVKKIRRKLADDKIAMPSQERKAIEAKVAEWDVKREWLPEAAVAMFTTQLCNWCGSRHSLFTGLLQRQRSRLSSVDRWVKVDANLLSGLPKETKHMTEHSDMCMSCIESHRYPQGDI